MSERFTTASLGPHVDVVEMTTIHTEKRWQEFLLVVAVLKHYLIFFLIFFFQTESYYVTQVGPELLSSSDHPDLVS
jgi:hypothetical protein